MRKLFTILMILTFVLAVVFAKEEPEPTQPMDVPDLGQVEHADEDVVVPLDEDTSIGTRVEDKEAEEPEVVKEEPSFSGVEQVGETLGTRTEGTMKEAVEEEVEEGVEEIMLNPDKTMSSTEMTVAAGTTLAWKNYDSWPHQLAVETGSGFDTVRHAESTRLLEGNVWEYTFEDKGTFLVRDIYSGAMRMYVTVE